MNRKYVFILLLTFFIFGCVKENTFNFQKESQLLGGVGFDLDKDGVQELTLYRFTPLTATEGNKHVTFNHYLYIRPNEFSVQTELNESESLYEERIRHILSESMKVYSQCRRALPKCSSPNSCLSSCFSSSCKEYSSEDLGLILKDFSDLLTEIDGKRAQVEASLLRSKSTKEFNETYSRASELYVLLESLRYHPAVVHLKLCNGDFDDSVFSFLRINSQVDVKSFTALDFVYVIPDSVDEVVEIRMETTLSPFLTPDVKSLTVTEKTQVISSDPIKIKHSQRRLTKSIKDVLAYLFVGTFDNSPQLVKSWAVWNTNIRFISIQLPFVDDLKSFMFNVYSVSKENTGLTFLSIGLALGVLVFIISVFVEFLSFFYSFITNVVKRPVGEALLVALSGGDEYWFRKILLGLLFLTISIGVEMYFSTQVNLTSFESYELREVFENDNAGFLSSLGVVISLYFVLQGIFGFFKEITARPLRKKYVARVDMRTLSKLYNEVKKLLDEKSELGIDVEEEYNKWLMINLKSLKEMKGREKDKAIAEAYKILLGVQSSLEKKEQIAKESYPEWDAYIREVLSDRDVVSLNSLIAIPPQWRLWAAHKYIENHPEENVILKGESLVREKLPLDERVKRLAFSVSKEKLLYLYLERPGKLYFVYKTSPHKEFAKVLGFQIHQKMILKGISEIFSEGDGCYLIAKRFNNVFFILLTKDRDVVNSFMEKLERFSLEG